MNTRSLVISCALLAVSTGAFAQGAKAPPKGGDSFVLKGVVADSGGPLANHTVIVSPIEQKSGKPQNRFVPTGGSRMESMNPRVKTDAKGAFTVDVPKALFRNPKGCVGCEEWRKGEVSIGVFTDMGGGRMTSSLESVNVRLDEKDATVDAGRLVLKPLK